MIIGQEASISSLINPDQHTSTLGTGISVLGLNDTKIRMGQQDVPSHIGRHNTTAAMAGSRSLDAFTSAKTMENSIIESFVLIETKPMVKDIYTRNYSLNMSHEKTKAFEDLVERANVKNKAPLSDILVAREIPDIMEYSRMAGKKIDIVNGWNTSRFRFFLKLKSKIGSQILHHYIQGYTDYLDNNMLRGAIDTQNMTCYINSIIETDEIYNNDGTTLGARITKNINVINNGSEIIIQELQTGLDRKIARPEDIYQSMINVADNEGNTTFDFASSISHVAKSSNKFNNDGINHFTKVINAAITADLIGADDISFVATSNLRNAENAVQEPSLTQIPFIKALSSLTNSVPASSFNINQLAHIYKDRFQPPLVIEDNTIMATDVAKQLGYQVNIDARSLDSTNMHETYDASLETSIAYSLHNKLCSYMSTMRFGEITITMSNLTLDGTTLVEAWAQPLIENVSDGEFIKRLETVKANCRHVLFNEISKNNERPISVLVNMKWLGKTTIAIDLKSSLGGNELKTYSFPTYADSLYSPVVGDTKTFNVMVQDYGNLIETIK